MRGYSRFVEQHGAEAGSQLLSRYRSIARAAIARFDGAEVQTEGDSFFVVFSSVSAAVRCGLALVNDAGSESTSEQPIPVGVGIHAGETVETGDSYIGSGVNIAARICSQAQAGEVLVSETVRALTRNVLVVGFTPRGRPQLKGIAERLPLYAVTEAPSDARSRLGRRRLVAVGGLALLALSVAVIGVGWAMSQRAPGLPPGDWKIGLITPLSGFDEGDEFFHHVRNSVDLALDELNAAGGVHGQPLSVTVMDDQLDEFRPAELTENLVADPSVLAMLGPYASGQAVHAMPISHAAGLLQCSPTNTDPVLTKPRHGALDLRGDQPDRISFVRIPPADDIQGKALAIHVFAELGVRHVLVVEDYEIGRDMAEQFRLEFEKLGGVVTMRQLPEDADALALIEPLLNGSSPPNAVFFSGMTQTGGPEVRAAMAEAGHADMPYLAWDAMLDSAGDVSGSYINQVGAELAAGTYVSHAALPAPKFSFVDRYRARFGTEPDEWGAAAYSCMEIIFDAIRATATQDMTAAQLRDGVRQYAVDEQRRYETVVGDVAFDANGDNVRQFVGIYRVDPSAAGGAGDWVLIEQRDYGPAP